MFQILNKTVRTGTVTVAYPKRAAQVPENARGAPEFDFGQWRDARPATEACPTGAITGPRKEAHNLDQSKCIKCRACHEVCKFDAIAGDAIIVVPPGERTMERTV